jgi:hypothetical protein
MLRSSARAHRFVAESWTLTSFAALFVPAWRPFRHAQRTPMLGRQLRDWKTRHPPIVKRSRAFTAPPTDWCEPTWKG